MEKLSCVSRLCDRMSNHRQFKPKLIMSCAGVTSGNGGGGGVSTAAGCSSSSHTRLNHIDLVRGHITSSSSLANAAGGGGGLVAAGNGKLHNHSITVNYPQKAGAGAGAGAVDQIPNRLSLVDVCNHHVSQSHITLSSHFEENNWDYNFATRGLYMSQPWVRGR